MSTDTQSKPTPAASTTESRPKGADPATPAAASAPAEPTSPQAATPATPEEAAPVSKEELALDIVKKYMYGNAAASLVPIPVLDLVATCGIQLAMARAVAGVYGVPFKQEAAREIVTILVSGLSTRSLGLTVAFSFAKLLPGVGTAAGAISLPVITAALTYAVGKVFILHFEAGGNVLNLDAKKMRTYFEQTFKEGMEQAKAAAKEKVAAL